MIMADRAGAPKGPLALLGGGVERVETLPVEPQGILKGRQADTPRLRTGKLRLQEGNTAA